MQMVEDCIRRILLRELGRDPTFVEVKGFYDQKLNCRYVEPNDSKVFRHVYQEGRWSGIFQFTSDGARKFCVAAKPENIIDLSTITAIYRPGPLKDNVHKKYVEAKQNRDAIKYDHPVIEEVLGPTCGFIVFQEQFMVLAQKLAGFSPGDSDKMRKTLVKKDLTSLGKKSEEKEALEKKFVSGCIEKSGLTPKQAQDLFDTIAYFSLYGFNKSLYFLQKVVIIRNDTKMEIAMCEVEPGDLIPSRDEKTGNHIWVKVIDRHDHGVLDVFDVTLDNGEKVRCTMDHKFRTTCGRMLPLKQILSENLEIVSIV